MNAREVFERGLRHYDLNRFEDAFCAFTQAIELDPASADSYIGRGLVHSIKGNYRDAAVDFTSAIDLNSSIPIAWKGRADALQILAQFDEAIQDYDEAIRLDASDADSFHRRGDAHSAIGNLDQARRDYLQATLLNPNNPISQYLLADVLARQRRFSEAIDQYEEAIQTDPELDAFVYSSLAWILATAPDAELRNPTRAIELARTACELAGWIEDESLGVLAAAHAAKGEFSDAVKWQERACAVARKDRQALQLKRLDAYRIGKPVIGTGDP